MLHVNFKAYNNYITDSLYQWDLNQDLVIANLGLEVAPEIHFANANMDRAIVRQSTIDGGVITVKIPNSLLQEALTIKAYVGVYEGETFKVIETIEIPVIPKKRPFDYTIEDTDEEIYSFKALEKLVNDTLKELTLHYDDTLQEVENTATNAKAEIDEKVADAEEEITKIKDEAIEVIYGLSVSNETTLVDSKNGGLRFTKIVGNTVQNGVPSPANPVPLLSTGDCVDMIQGYYSSSGYYRVETSISCSKNPKPCKSGDVVKVETDKATGIDIVYYSDSGFLGHVGMVYDTKKMEQTVPSGATRFVININEPLESLPKITITINGKYLGCAKTNKELFDGESESAVYNNATGVKVGDSGWCCAKNPIPCKKGESILVKHSFTVDLIRLFFYKTDGTFVKYKQVASEKITEFSTVADDDGYFIWAILDSVVVSPSTLGELSITSSTNETIAWYTTQYPMIAGSTLFRENGLVKAMHGYVEETYNGGADDTIYSWNLTRNIFEIIPKTNLATTTDGTVLSDIACTHYPTRIWDELYALAYDYATSIRANGSSAIMVRDKDCSTVNEFKAKLQANPITMLFPRATPIIETLDADSQIALNSLETFDGVTYIEFDTRVQPLEFECEYGTRQVGAYTLKSLNNSESNAVKIDKVTSAMLALSQG